MNIRTFIILCLLYINGQMHSMHPAGLHAYLAQHAVAQTLTPQSQGVRAQQAQLRTLPSISYSSYGHPQQRPHSYRPERALVLPANRAITPTPPSFSLDSRQEWPTLPAATQLSDNQEWPDLPSNNPQAARAQPVQPSSTTSSLASVASTANRPKRQPKKFTFAPIATSSQK